MQILAIDPGPKYSAFVLYYSETRMPLRFGEYLNETVEKEIKSTTADTLVIEYPAPRGQPMYTQLVDTIFWIGRFSTHWQLGQWHRMDRKDVKMTLCRSAKANDSQIRAAIISRYPATGGGKVGQIGTKKQGGPLYGISKDVWAALAVAISHSIRNGLEDDTIISEGEFLLSL